MGRGWQLQPVFYIRYEVSIIIIVHYNIGMKCWRCDLHVLSVVPVPFRVLPLCLALHTFDCVAPGLGDAGRGVLHELQSAGMTLGLRGLEWSWIGFNPGVWKNQGAYNI